MMMHKRQADIQTDQSAEKKKKTRNNLEWTFKPSVPSAGDVTQIKSGCGDLTRR